MSTLFFRAFQHLLPDSIAWRIRFGSAPWLIGDGSKIGDPGLLIGGTAGGRDIDRFFEGLASSFADSRQFVDLVYLDIFPESTRELDEWEKQFGLIPAAAGADRIANVEAAWQSTGGQSPRYLQDIVQAAGFDVFIHPWWSSTNPFVVKDPRTHTNEPLLGTVQCGESLALCGESSALANSILANEPGYIVNLNLTLTAPPGIPSDPATWPFFLYWGGETFPTRASVPANRRGEFERLILQLCPAQQWLVTLIDYT